MEKVGITASGAKRSLSLVRNVDEAERCWRTSSPARQAATPVGERKAAGKLIFGAIGPARARGS
jgi:hypothetical protein